MADHRTDAKDPKRTSARFVGLSYNARANPQQNKTARMMRLNVNSLAWPAVRHAVSTNITPGKETGIGNYIDSDEGDLTIAASLCTADKMTDIHHTTSPRASSRSPIPVVSYG
jgi:hypothetical protein